MANEQLMVGPESREWILSKPGMEGALAAVEHPEDFVFTLIGNEDTPDLLEFYPSVEDAQVGNFPYLTICMDEDAFYVPVQGRYTAHTYDGSVIGYELTAQKMGDFVYKYLTADNYAAQPELAYTFDNSRPSFSYTTWKLSRGVFGRDALEGSPWRSFEQVCVQLCKFPGLYLE